MVILSEFLKIHMLSLDPFSDVDEEKTADLDSKVSKLSHFVDGEGSILAKLKNKTTVVSNTGHSSSKDIDIIKIEKT